MKTVLIGQAPSRTSDPRRPLSGDPLASKLAALCGLTKAEYLRAFERRNLLDRWPGKATKGDAWPAKEALSAAWNLGPRLRGRRAIFLGRRVAEAFGMPKRAPFLDWVAFRVRPRPGNRAGHSVGEAAIFPHPSGVNLWWNDPRNVRRAARFLKGELRWKRS